MTATAIPPATSPAPALDDDAPAGPPSSTSSKSGPRRDAPAFLGWAELALALVTLAAVLGFSRLFDGWDFFWPLAAVAAFSHMVTLVTRRLGRGLLVAGGVGLAGLLLITSWMWFFDTTMAGIPTVETLHQARGAINESWTSFHELQAPVPAQTGLLLVSAIALFFAVFLADWAAFRLWSPIESLVPTATLFIFGAVLGAEQYRVASAMAYCSAVAAFLLLHRLVRIDLAGSWISGQAGIGGRWLLTTGALIATVAVLGGAVIGGALPGMDDPVIDWRGDQGRHGPRVTVSPLVDIRNRLVDQSDREVFTVESPEPAYWRLTALDTFDGTIWRSGGKYQEANGELPANIPKDAAGATIDQTFTITGLSAIWLPAAYQPIAIDPKGADVRYQASSSTLIVDTDLKNSDELTYTVHSEVPAIDPAALADEGPLDLDDDLDELTELPSGFSPAASTLAQQVVEEAGAVSPYEQALALQNFFQDEGVFADDDYDWTYDLSVPAGHDNDAIDEFLTRQSGYCEQYAGTYAAMARSLGLPSRVAVGFTWGEADESNANLYTVSGRNAHAWPEVWLGSDVGWVSFEPTPGRGEPGHEAVTGVQPDQEEVGTGGTIPPTTEAPTPTTSVDGSSTTTSSVPSTTPPTTSPSVETAASDGDGTSTSLAMAIGAFLIAVLALLLLATPLVKRTARQRRRHAATTPGRRVDLAWLEAVDDLSLAGVSRAPAETHREYGARAGVVFPASEGAIALLASSTEVGVFSDEEVDESVANRAEGAASEIHEALRGQVSIWRRIAYALDPRTLRR